MFPVEYLSLAYMVVSDCVRLIFVGVRNSLFRFTVQLVEFRTMVCKIVLDKVVSYAIRVTHVSEHQTQPYAKHVACCLDLLWVPNTCVEFRAVAFIGFQFRNIILLAEEKQLVVGHFGASLHVCRHVHEMSVLCPVSHSYIHFAAYTIAAATKRRDMKK